MRRSRKRPSCGCGKACYRTQGEAIRALTRIHVGNLQAAAPTKDLKGVYRCPRGVWHLSSKEQS